MQCQIKFPSFRGAGGQIKFLIKKNMWRNIGIGGVALGKILGRLAFYTWVNPTPPLKLFHENRVMKSWRAF